MNAANTRLSRATSQHVVGNHARVVASAAGGVRKDSLNLPRFLSQTQYSFCFFPTLLFALSRFAFFAGFLFSPNHFLVRCFTIFYFLRGTLFLFFHDTLFLAAFKMGVKIFRTITIFPCSPRYLSFVASRYL